MKMNRNTRVGSILAVTIVGAFLVSDLPAPAHHAFSAEFDENQPITLEGTITRIEWINPHAWIHIDVESEAGPIESWMIEAGSPNTLVRRGMTRDSIPAGTEVVVFGYRHRNGSNRANGRNVTLPDGSQLFLSSPGTGVPGGDRP